MVGKTSEQMSSGTILIADSIDLKGAGIIVVVQNLDSAYYSAHNELSYEWKHAKIYWYHMNGNIDRCTNKSLRFGTSGCHILKTEFIKLIGVLCIGSSLQDTRSSYVIINQTYHISASFIQVCRRLAYYSSRSYSWCCPALTWFSRCGGTPEPATDEVDHHHAYHQRLDHGPSSGPLLLLLLRLLLGRLKKERVHWISFNMY